MPELPEVQTVISDLNKKIKGDIITGFWSDHRKAIKNKFEYFVKEIKGRKILETRRIGKNIFINLSGGKTIYIHLKMTGHLLVKPANFQFPISPASTGPRQGGGNFQTNYNNQISKSKKLMKFRRKVGIPTEASELKANEAKSYFGDRVNQYIHHIFYLGKDKTLEFSDLRKFGKIVLVDTEKVNEIKEIKKLGIDAINKNFTLDKFEEILEKKKSKKVRDILMDQNIISGIGNIYASEILHEAGIVPTRITGKISEKEKKLLFDSMKKVLEKAIIMRGTSDSDYRDTSGKPGGFQKVLKVYQRDGTKCKICGTIIKRIKMGQRSAFYCPKCQK